MKQSIQTGGNIRDYINNLEKEVVTIKKSMEDVAFKMGKDTPTYGILLGNLEEAESKLNKILETKYAVVGR